MESAIAFILLIFEIESAIVLFTESINNVLSTKIESCLFLIVSITLIAGFTVSVLTGLIVSDWPEESKEKNKNRKSII